MQIEQLRPSIFRVTLHGYELSTLVSAARWASNGADGELPDEALEQLEHVLAQYDAAREALASSEQ